MCGFVAEGGEKPCQLKKAVLAQEGTGGLRGPVSSVLLQGKVQGQQGVWGSEI